MEKKPLNFVCWLWGDYKRTISTKKPFSFAAEDVNNLYVMLKRYYKKPFNLICITDMPKDINPEIKIVPLWDDLRDMGFCFTRLICFKKGMRKILGERFVSMDLDCVIVDDITSLFERDDDFVIWKSASNKNPYCGSMWMLKTGTKSEIYKRFNRNEWKPNERGRYPTGSDQAQIAKVLPNELTWNGIDDGVYSFKSIRKKGLPDNAKIVFFNGNFHPGQRYIQRECKWINKFYPGVATENKNTLNIVCFYWQGNIKSGWENPRVGAKYINNLYLGVRKHLTLPFRFFCFHQRGLQMKEVGKEIEKITFDSPSWYRRIPKMKIFDKDIPLDGRIVTFDLDVIITGSLNDICSYKGDFMTRGSFKDPTRSGGDIVSFEAKKYPFWDMVQEEHPLIISSKGNERVIFRKYFKDPDKNIDYIQLLYPDQIYSYKHHVRNTGTIPENCRILSCHGKPRIHRIENREVRRHWK